MAFLLETPYFLIIGPSESPLVDEMRDLTQMSFPLWLLLPSIHMTFSFFSIMLAFTTLYVLQTLCRKPTAPSSITRWMEWHGEYWSHWLAQRQQLVELTPTCICIFCLSILGQLFSLTFLFPFASLSVSWACQWLYPIFGITLWEWKWECWKTLFSTAVVLTP